MKVFVGLMDSILGEELLNHVYESFYNIFMEQEQSLGKLKKAL